MGFLKKILRRSDEKRPDPIAVWLQDGDICCSGYTKLSDNPEIQTACLAIAKLVGSMTIRLMENTDDGDKRILNELSRALDISPNGNMGRSHWLTTNVMNMLLYGKGNAICVPHTYEGILRSLEPISPERVSFLYEGY